MGIKYTSDVFQISASVVETVVNTPATTTINLNLDSLSREVLVIQYVDIDVSIGDLVPGVRTQMNCSLTNTDIGVQGISNPQTIATANHTIESTAGEVVAFSNAEPRYAQMQDSALFVSGTDNLFLSVAGSNNVATLIRGQVRIYARRAQATADTYAAILTSQFS
jgi:hypothetical protein